MKYSEFINKGLRKLGIEIKRYPSYEALKKTRLIESNNINLVLDIGANKGDYAFNLIETGFKGKIISFEPISEVYDILNYRSSKNVNWDSYKIGIGDFNGRTNINISKNIHSSSILNMLPSHENSAPSSIYYKKESIEVKRLDTIWKDLNLYDYDVFVKLDVQGYEKQVLDGAMNVLDQISGIQIELSLVELYENSILYRDMMEFLEEKGFILYGLENGFTDPISGRLLQFDGVFFKS